MPNFQLKMTSPLHTKILSDMQTKMMEEARSQASFESEKMAEVIHGRQVTTTL